VGLLPLGYFVFLRRPPPPPPAPPKVLVEPPGAVVEPDAGVAEVPKAQADLKVTEVSGLVEVRLGGGGFAPAGVGTVLQADDAIRTGNGRARLTAQNAYEVQVEPGTMVEVGELTEHLSRFELGVGMLVAKVEGTGRKLEIAAAKSDAVAVTEQGTFAMSNNGQGTVAVGSRDGNVEFRAAGKAVVLRGGQQSVAKPGRAPSAPAPIPSSLFLKIDWPKTTEVNHRFVTVRGKAAPGSVVLVGGKATPVKEDGRFVTKVRLREGTNSVEAECIDLGGNRSSQKSEFTVDTKAPDTDITTKNLWD